MIVRIRSLTLTLSKINPSPQVCLVKHRDAYFKRLSQAASRVEWFDYEIGERGHKRGFVCDARKVSNRVEKLAPPQ
jgi:hypothetical protein